MSGRSATVSDLSKGGCAVALVEGPAANGIYSLAWSSWRARGAALSKLLLQRDSQTARQEPLACGILLMDNEWGRRGVFERTFNVLLRQPWTSS
mmetsp:Transcript_78323/g.181717  ORF Transcript_78323/g.181717 Transcript_78323/m.181717 type:complete len:94 (+) Transcript_78323:67-348(+)